MGKRITQRIYECSLCESKPKDGEYLWEMGREIWCESCINKLENDEE